MDMLCVQMDDENCPNPFITPRVERCDSYNNEFGGDRGSTGRLERCESPNDQKHDGRYHILWTL